MKILYIEDDDDSVYSVRHRLERAGHTILVARDGERGVMMAQSENPDIILMDLSLPLLDGWEATRRLNGEVERVLQKDAPTRDAMLREVSITLARCLERGRARKAAAARR